MKIPEIIKSIKYNWTRTDLITKNNIYFQRVQTNTDTPYMKINCRVDSIESVNNGEANLVTYTVDISIWGDDGMANSSVYSGIINSMMNNLVPNNSSSLPFVPGFLHCLPKLDTLMLDANTKLGKDVLITNSSWTILVQEDR